MPSTRPANNRKKLTQLAKSRVRPSPLRAASYRVRDILLLIDLRTYHRFVVPLVAFLPAPLAYGVALFRSDLRYRLLGSSRRNTLYSLELLFGSRLGPRARDRIGRDYYRNLSCGSIDAMRMLGSGKALLNLVEVRGVEHLKAACAGGRGVIVCTAHFGSASSASCMP